MPKSRKAYLEITNRCNLNCAFCPGTDRPKGSLDEEAFAFLARRLSPFAEYLYYHLMGEPLAHPFLPRFLEIASELGMKSVITTNGTLLPTRGDALLEGKAKPHKASISLHSLEANDAPLDFEAYLDGCLAFAEKAAEAGVIAVLRLWNLDGRAEGALHEKNEQILKRMKDCFPDDWQEIRTGCRIKTRLFLEWGEKFDWPTLQGDVLSESGFCYALRDQVGVLCDGTVVPCCLDRNGDLALGNLFEQPLDEILSSPRARRLYDGFTAHRCEEELCRRCMRAGYYRNSP